MRFTLRRLASQILLGAGLSAALLTCGITEEANADEVPMQSQAGKPVKSVWQLHEVKFTYFGQSSIYSCDSLIEKLKGFLSQTGAREDLVVSRMGCTERFRAERYPGARVVLAIPVEATDENIRAIANDPKQAALAERLQRKSKSADAASTEPFEATWQSATLNTKEPPRSTAHDWGDCELLDQMRRNIFPKLGIKVVYNDVHCTPYLGSPVNLKMKIEVLAATPAATS